MDQLLLSFQNETLQASIQQNIGLLLHIGMKDVKVTHRIHNTGCTGKIEQELTGCHSCHQAAQLTLNCHSTRFTTACQPSPETTKSMESPKISRKSASSAPAVNITHGSVSGTKPHIRSLAGSRFSDSASDHIWQEIAQNHTKCQRCPTRAHHILLCPRLTEDEQASLRETFNRLLQERYH
uniref:Phlebovirus glycoprotein G2 fusion domain-containing protein n=1 Tax=Bursaphelenchus xylophilus TaxID=6326 RepID=A0A1I7RMY5_BURXY